MTQPLVSPVRISTPIVAPPPVEFPRLATPRFRSIKRTLDVTAALVLALVALPVSVLIALAILLESGHPVFYSQERLGRGRRRFRLWKFRTMVVEGDEILDRYLAENPDQRLEWEHNRKLRHDPRVTRVGRFLRRTSLDELPQVWNILRGDMSMVGPRPIVDSEVEKYGPAFPLYALAKPGLTGLWQVSGRNDTTYHHRVELDASYVRNWTPALDIKLLARTVRVVLTGKGAY